MSSYIVNILTDKYEKYQLLIMSGQKCCSNCEGLIDRENIFLSKQLCDVRVVCVAGHRNQIENYNFHYRFQLESYAVFLHEAVWSYSSITNNS